LKEEILVGFGPTGFFYLFLFIGTCIKAYKKTEEKHSK
jgi:hypothetical protein